MRSICLHIPCGLAHKITYMILQTGAGSTGSRPDHSVLALAAARCLKMWKRWFFSVLGAYVHVNEKKFRQYALTGEVMQDLTF